MPVFTIYGKVLRNRKRGHKVSYVAVSEFYEVLTDYEHLKSVLLDAAKRVYHEHEHQTVTEISIDRHLSGKYIQGMVSYRQSRIRYQRQPAFKATIIYNPKIDSVRVEKAQFLAPETWNMRDDYRREHGRKWVLPAVVPAGLEKSLNNPALLFVDLNPVKNLSYGAPPENSYGSSEEKHHQTGSYASIPQGMYAPSGWQTVETDKAEKETEH